MRNHVIAFTVVFLLAACPSVLFAQDLASNSYQQGLDQAATSNSCLLVLVHGSDWNPPGEELFRQWPELKIELESVVFADVDLMQNPEHPQFEANRSRNEIWPEGNFSIPAVLAFAPDGRRLGVRTRIDLLAEDTNVADVIKTLAQDATKRIQLESEIIEARESGDTETELKLAAKMLALPLDRPEIDLDRVKELDPDDKFGVVAQMNFPNLFTIIQQATADATSGKSDEAIVRYSELLEHETYTAEQRALIWLALGTVHHRTEGHSVNAKSAFENAVEEAPESVPGKIALQRLEQIDSSAE